MPTLVYMESAYRKEDRTGVLHCEVMLPGKGQVTVNKAVRDATMRQMTREKLLLLADLLQNGAPDGSGGRKKLHSPEVSVYTSDRAFWEDMQDHAVSIGDADGMKTRNGDVCARIEKACDKGGYHVRCMGKSLLQRLVRDEAYRYLKKQEVAKIVGTGKST